MLLIILFSSSIFLYPLLLYCDPLSLWNIIPSVLLTFDIDKIKAAGYDLITPIVITNTNDYEIAYTHTGHTNNDNIMFKTKRREA